jgi:hypothetical protein
MRQSSLKTKANVPVTRVGPVMMRKTISELTRLSIRTKDVIIFAVCREICKSNWTFIHELTTLCVALSEFTKDKPSTKKESLRKKS